MRERRGVLGNGGSSSTCGRCGCALKLLAAEPSCPPSISLIDSSPALSLARVSSSTAGLFRLSPCPLVVPPAADLLWIFILCGPCSPFVGPVVSLFSVLLVRKRSFSGGDAAGAKGGVGRSEKDKLGGVIGSTLGSRGGEGWLPAAMSAWRVRHELKTLPKAFSVESRGGLGGGELNRALWRRVMIGGGGGGA